MTLLENAEIRSVQGELSVHVVALHRLRLVNRDAHGLRLGLQGIGLGAGRVRWTVDGDDFVIARQSLQRFFAEGRLADQNDAQRHQARVRTREGLFHRA